MNKQQELQRIIRMYREEKGDFGKGALYGGLAIATAIAILFSFGSIAVDIAGIVNPEYWALKQVLK